MSRPGHISRVLLTLAIWWPILHGCGALGRHAPPEWIEGTSKAHPPDQYLVGVGRGDSAPVAAEKAYAAVAKIFKAEVTAQSRDWESFLLVENRATAKSERRLTVDQVTNVSTDKVIENVRVLETWVEAKTVAHYALAGLNRAQAGAAMQERIADLDRTVDGQIQEARRSSHKLTRIRSLRRAIKALVLREAYNADLRIIRVSGQGIPTPHQVFELTSELERFLASNFSVSVKVSGDQEEAVRRAVTEGLLREGLPVVNAPAGSAEEPGRPSELSVNGTVRLWKVDVPDPHFKYVRWCSDFIIVEHDAQLVVGAVSRSGKEGHLSHGEASAKAVRAMQQEVTAELAKTLAGYVYGEDEPPTNPPPAACPRGDGVGDRQ